MSITIVVYDSKSNVVEKIGNFSTAKEAAYYRDHSGLNVQSTKLEYLSRDDQPVSVQSFEAANGVVPACEHVDYSHAEANGWVKTSEGWLCDE